MKKGAFIFLLFLSSNTVFSQFSFGPRVGLNLNPQSKSNVYGTEYLNSFNGGLMGRYRLNSWLSFKAEVNYNTKRKKYSFTTQESLLTNLNKTLDGLIDTSILNSAGSFINDTVYSYYKGTDAARFVELPIMAYANYKNFEIGAGMYLGYLVKVNSKEELNQESALLDIILPAIDSIQFVGPLVSGILTSSYPGYKAPALNESSSKSAFRVLDYGFISEITYHTSDRLFFSFRYSRGFNNYRLNPIRSMDVYNTFTLSTGYTFGTSYNTKPKGIYDLEKIPVETIK
jgi:hypothetical protein